MQEEPTGQEIYENNLINRWVEKYLKAKEELEEYKKSKQASYEALQAKCNELELSNRRLMQECEEIRQTLIKTKERLDDTIAPDISALEELPKEILNESLYSLYEKLKEKTAECEELNTKYIDVLNLAKQNADANEYCLRDLEKENAKLKTECEELKNTFNKLTRGIVMPMNEPEVINLAERYKQALDEIEKITKCSVDQDCCECPLCTLCEELCINEDNLQRIILDIISKAKGEK